VDQVEYLSSRDAAAVAGPILGRAFAEDPVWHWFVRGPDRERRLVDAFTAFLAVATRAPGAQVLVTPERTAAAVWRAPGGWKDSARAALPSTPAMARALRVGGMLRGMRMQAALTRNHPDEPHWYLEALGALPEARGTGGGARVVQPLLDRCDDEGVLAYLESSNPRNLPFYERHGFVPEAPLPVGGGCPPMIPMRRRPR
jgi:GNAT superfamily N-acetyltransferase